MRHLLTLAAAALLPLTSSNALEAVAQQPYYQNAGKSLTNNLKVDIVSTQVQNINTKVTHILECNEEGKLYDGTNCVAAGGNLTLNCPSGKFLVGINNGNPVCADAPAGVDGVDGKDGKDGKDATAPVCAANEALNGGTSGTLVCAPKIDRVRVVFGPKNLSSVATCAGNETVIGGSCNCDAPAQNPASPVINEKRGNGWKCECDDGFFKIRCNSQAFAFCELN